MGALLFILGIVFGIWIVVAALLAAAETLIGDCRLHIRTARWLGWPWLLISYGSMEGCR